MSDAQATVSVISKRDPSKSWECLLPQGNDETTRPELGACMPDALCDKNHTKK
jgi:hypothetical protein